MSWAWPQKLKGMPDSTARPPRPRWRGRWPRARGCGSRPGPGKSRPGAPPPGPPTKPHRQSRRTASGAGPPAAEMWAPPDPSSPSPGPDSAAISGSTPTPNDEPGPGPGPCPPAAGRAGAVEGVNGEVEAQTRHGVDLVQDKGLGGLRKPQKNIGDARGGHVSRGEEGRFDFFRGAGGPRRPGGGSPWPRRKTGPAPAPCPSVQGSARLPGHRGGEPGMP